MKDIMRQLNIWASIGSNLESCFSVNINRATRSKFWKIFRKPIAEVDVRGLELVQWENIMNRTYLSELRLIQRDDTQTLVNVDPTGETTVE